MLVFPDNRRELYLFDCGTLHGLKTRDLLKVRWLFLSHLHIDHLIGFDHLLRLRLFSDLPLTVFGPPGTTEVIGHRLQGYAWNLTSGSPFEVRSVDLDATGPAQSARFSCHEQFQAEPFQYPASASGSKLTLAPDLSLAWQALEHGVPCYGYRLYRHFLPNFSPQIAESLGLKPGPWVKKLLSGQSISLDVQGEKRNQEWLSSRLLKRRESQSIGYLTDTLLHPRLTDSLADFFQGVDVLISECAYLDRDQGLATQNLHMTTKQVGQLALAAQAQNLSIFHLSKRYSENGAEEHLKEVSAIFPRVELLSQHHRASSAH